MKAKTILTGDRPTGKLHLGHYLGTLENRVKLQDDYESLIMLADVQALTDNFDNPKKVRESVYEVALDNLAVGLDPAKSHLFIQSMVPEIAELTVYFMNLVTLARLKRNPTVKSEMEQKGFGSNVPVGFLNYPVSEAADILAFGTDLVPAGEDQQPMVEQTREIVRKFNRTYGVTFKVPEILVGRIARLVGTDGSAKMSKSLGNVIYLSDDAAAVEKKVMGMYTDPNRLKADDAGSIQNNPVFIYLDAFATTNHLDTLGKLKERYIRGEVGDVEVKRYLALVLNEFLDPIRERRAFYEARPELVQQILKDGTKAARELAAETLVKVKSAMQLDYDKDGIM
jgi:tryptophanyl-tRNA synthetase